MSKIAGEINAEMRKSYVRTATAEPGDENSRRIVACVNACAEIPTEELERQCSSRYIVSKTDLVRMVNEATKQRDELLVAARIALRCLIYSRDKAFNQDAIVAINAAIASVKGGA